MQPVIPRVFIVCGLSIIAASLLSLPIAPVLVLLALGMAFAFDVLWTYYQRHQIVLEWIIDRVKLTNEPVKESDAPESVKKLVRREGDKTNT